MFINIASKRLDKKFAVSATFSHEGVKYEERFNKYSHFLLKVKKTKDVFLHAVDHHNIKVIYPRDIICP